jgi:hypothetical protein
MRGSSAGTEWSPDEVIASSKRASFSLVMIFDP